MFLTGVSPHIIGLLVLTTLAVSARAGKFWIVVSIWMEKQHVVLTNSKHSSRISYLVLKYYKKSFLSAQTFLIRENLRANRPCSHHSYLNLSDSANKEFEGNHRRRRKFRCLGTNFKILR